MGAKTVTKHMTVNFNNLRLQACHAYERLATKLNRAILAETQWGKPNDHFGQEIDIKGYVLVDAEDIQKDMESLKSLIGSIACVYEEGSEEFKSVLPEKPLTDFNPEPDDETTN